MQNSLGDGEFEFRESKAARMLKNGLARAAVERGLSVRGAAKELGYKASVVISHMQTGRVPIPLNRAPEIAAVVGLPVGAFCLAVLEQRYPEAFPAIVAGIADENHSGLAQDLQVLAGCPLDDLPNEHQRVLREVVAERSPGRRWLAIPELPAVLLLRSMREDLGQKGLGPTDMDAVERTLS